MRFNPSQYLRWPVERFPERICTSFNGRTRTYAEVNERANRLANRLRQRGVEVGERAATLQHNCDRWFECFGAMWKAGITMVPLNARNTARENIDILRDSGAKVCFVDGAFTDQIGPIKDALPEISLICHDGGSELYEHYEDVISEADSGEPDIDVDENMACRISYTSGTTGKPRGVIHTYRNRRELAANMIVNADFLIDENEVLLHVAPLTHASGNLSTPFYLKGAKHVVLDRFEPARVLQTIEEQGVTTALFVPTMIGMLVESGFASQYNLESLRRIYYGTASISRTCLTKAIRTFGNIFRQNYGLSEAVQPLCFLTAHEHVVDNEDPRSKRLASAGRRALGVEIRIVDESGKEALPDVIGEVILRGPHVSPGYYNAPKSTERSIKEGWLYTGDLAYRDEDRYIYLVDRKKDMIVSGGFNVYSREVENVLSEMPGVLETAVFGLPDEKWGEVVVAYLVMKNGGERPSREQVKNFCVKKGLSRYKTPKAVLYAEYLQKNNNGKIDKNALKKMALEDADYLKY